ncbi:PucR family transcriptional regulator [Actinoallomurus oryzae]|jgi:hypothetical protein|uniref:PucR family transcriptional regulator n=1 Tax=Actinoallomurus oryzae TaxID=502180 RepID=A0ABP8PFH5_9ACTN
MTRASRLVPLDELAALSRTTLRRVRIPDPYLPVRGVVLHTVGDPPPEGDLLVLCATPEAGLPGCAGVVVRESAVNAALAHASGSCAVFAVADSARWSDVYDRVRWAVGESFGKLAEHDAFHLADALATALGGAVAIEDARRRVVAFSTVPGQPVDEVRRKGILGRQVPEHVEREKWYARLWRSSGVCEFTDGTESAARLAIAVRAGTEPLGSIWAVGNRQVLCADADDVLTASVDAVAACLMHQDHFADRGRETRAWLLGRLLGSDASELDFTLPGPSVLVVLTSDDEVGERELLDTRLADVLSLTAHRFRGVGLAAVLDGRVYGLLPVTERDRLESYLNGVISRVTLPSGRVGVSDPIERADELAVARRRVDRLLTLRHRPRQSGVEIIHASAERDSLVLAELADAVRGLEALRGGVMGRVIAHDGEHGTAYLPTLRAWFETSGDVPAAAARLHIHPNTFRYRMTRAAELFGLRLDRPDERLLLHLQLRLAEL